MTQPPQIDQLRGRAAALHTALLVQIVVCVGPPMAAVGLGNPNAGGKWLYGALCAVLAWHAMARRPARYLAVLAGSIPAAMLLRDSFYYSALTVLLLAGVLLAFVMWPRDLRRFRRNVPLVGFTGVALVFWLWSYALNGIYTSNFRALELAFSALAIFVLGSRRSYLATALVGIGISTVAVGLGLAPHGHRLGMGEFGESSLGNPITLGLPAALVVLLAVAQRGKWLLAGRTGLVRTAVMMGVGACLILSTSRGSWLVAAAGLFAMFVLTKGAAKTSLLLPLIPLAAATVLVMISGRGEFVTMYFDRAVDPGLTLAQRTTGRYKQWAALPAVLADSPVWGHGPGTGLAVNIRFTGIHKAWHSLYLQVAVETGAIGILLLTLLFGALVSRGLRHRRVTGDVIPLTCTLCYMTIAVSVSGLDAISGVFLGLAFLAGDFTGFYVLREYVTAAPRQYAAPASAA